MHTLLIILIILLVILVILLGIVAFVVLSAFFAVQPILNQLGKISMIIEAAEFIKRRVRKAVLRRQSSARGRMSNNRRGERYNHDQSGSMGENSGYTRGRSGNTQNSNTSQVKDVDHSDEDPRS